MDEMTIRKKIQWDGHKTHGLSDFENVMMEGDNMDEATQTLVFLVTAIDGPFKVPTIMLDQKSSSKESEKKEIDDVLLLLTIKPIVATLLEYIKEVEDHTDSEQKQLGDDNPMAVERLKYTQLRDIYLKIVHKDMSKYLQLYREKVETDEEVQVRKKKKIVSNVIAMIMQAMMFMGRDIE
ncbi:unnamed protein product [Euphydryas editha]|uniref:Transposable element P transposase-like RNase H domain-containing protein n=1 Tax=Euphydryas editha TaxID=104508 RepID=A0AAU9TM00_EUPED|nr:unnamed protein product [Euphydryas editha]